MVPRQMVTENETMTEVILIELTLLSLGVSFFCFTLEQIPSR